MQALGAFPTRHPARGDLPEAPGRREGVGGLVLEGLSEDTGEVPAVTKTFVFFFFVAVVFGFFFFFFPPHERSAHPLALGPSDRHRPEARGDRRRPWRVVRFCFVLFFVFFFFSFFSIILSFSHLSRFFKKKMLYI